MHLKLAAFSLGASLVMMAAYIIRLRMRQESMWLALAFSILLAVCAGWHFGKYFQR